MGFRAESWGYSLATGEDDFTLLFLCLVGRMIDSFFFLPVQSEEHKRV